MTIPLCAFLAVASLLFCGGLAMTLTRSNAILVLVGIELMLGAANLNFIAFWRFGENPEALVGVLFVLFTIAIAAAEAAVGLALIVLLYRRFRTLRVNDATTLRG